MRKPDGMCTVRVDRQDKEVVVGFNKAEQAIAYRDHLIDLVVGDKSFKNESFKETGDVDESKIDAETLEHLHRKFQARWKYLDFIRGFDAWGREQYAHPHIQCLWQGFLAGHLSCEMEKKAKGVENECW